MKINPNEVEFDGHSFKLIIKDEKALLQELIKIQQQIMADLNLMGTDGMEESFYYENNDAVDSIVESTLAYTEDDTINLKGTK